MSSSATRSKGKDIKKPMEWGDTKQDKWQQCAGISRRPARAGPARSLWRCPSQRSRPKRPQRSGLANKVGKEIFPEEHFREIRGSHREINTRKYTTGRSERSGWAKEERIKEETRGAREERRAQSADGGGEEEEEERGAERGQRRAERGQKEDARSADRGGGGGGGGKKKGKTRGAREERKAQSADRRGGGGGGGKKDARSAKKREEIATARESVQWGPLQKEGRPGDGERRKPPEKGGHARRAEERARRAESGRCHLEEEEPHTGEKMAEAIQGTAQSCTEGRAQGPRRRSVDGEDGEE